MLSMIPIDEEVTGHEMLPASHDVQFFITEPKGILGCESIDQLGILIKRIPHLPLLF